MRVIDLSGPIRNGMWRYPDPYPAPSITEIPAPDWLDYPIYSQHVSMAVQTGTYLETAAHLDRRRPTIDRVDLASLVLVPAVVVRVAAEPGEEIGLGALQRALEQDERRPASLAGTALLVSTGWDRAWDDPGYVTDGPFFATDVIEWVVERARPSIFGADLPRFDSPSEPRNHLVTFFESDVLMLAPLRNLGAVPDEPGSLIALPLAIDGACASPVRAVWIDRQR